MCCSSVVASHSDRYCGACYQARPVSVDERSLIRGMQATLTDRGGFPMPPVQLAIIATDLGRCAHPIG